MHSLRVASSSTFLVALLAGAGFARATQDAEDAKAAPSASPTFTCVIVDGRNDAPIVDAEVRWYELADDGEPPDDTFDWLDRADEFALEDYSEDDVRAARAGHVARSDAGGRVTVNGPVERTIVLARSAELWGRTNGYLRNAAEQRLELFPDADVVARVFDAEGRPAPEVPVVIQYRLRGDQPIAKLRTTSDREGIARVAHAGSALARIRDGWDARSDAESQWSMAAQICAANRPEAALDPRALPNAPLDLHLPPLGEVELLVLQTTGQPAWLELAPALLLAENLPDDVGSGPVRGFSGGRGPRVRSPATEGRALFRHVGLGAALAAKIQPNRASQTWVERFQGPTAPNERVSVTVTLVSPSPTFIGRLVDPDGRPCANVRFATDLFALPSPTRIRFSNHGADEAIRSGGGNLTTDATGGFSLAYANDAAYGGKPLLVVTVARNEPNSRAARLELAELWTPGLHQLGDIVLTPTPVVAAGIVVDSQNRPIVGAFLGIAAFKSSARITAVSDERGAFELRSAEPHDELLILATATGHLSSHASARPGARELRIALERAGDITGPIVFPAGTRFGHFYFNIQRDVPGRVHHGWVEYHPGAGDLLFRDLEAGTYTVYVEKRGADGGKVVARSGIEVRAGETTTIEPIDLVALFANR
ncbi:MAG: carboxypeptidase-like regulatory domain-containing protein [Planctomycetes bacterium]|nr:carboxypeptidase-like regulatory domain-containing protein [Planctomycetota bacterium]